MAEQAAESRGGGGEGGSPGGAGGNGTGIEGGGCEGGGVGGGAGGGGSVGSGGGEGGGGNGGGAGEAAKQRAAMPQKAVRLAAYASHVAMAAKPSNVALLIWHEGSEVTSDTLKLGANSTAAPCAAAAHAASLLEPP